MLALEKQNRTKIVATMGPASCSEATLHSIFEEGVDVVRLNFSHGSHSDHHGYIRTVRSVAAQCQEHVAIIADLQGPKIRTGPLEGGEAVELTSGQELVITTEDTPGTSQRVSTTYQALPSDVNKGDRILLDDGALELQVTDTKETEVHCQIIIGGTLGEHKGINLDYHRRHSGRTQGDKPARRKYQCPRTN